MNLMINTYCNFSCPYCFAKQEMKENLIKNISEDNFRIYLDFLKNNGEKDVRLIGGEPTLHPDFFKFLDIIIGYSCFDNVMIFSNFSFSMDFAEKIVEYNKKIPIEFLPNVNYNPQYNEIVERNLDFLSASMPERIYRISINIYDPNQDLSYWENLVAKYNIRDIRWSITVPNMKLKKDFNFKEYFHSFQKVLKELVSWATKYNVTYLCDCNNLPICAFDDDFISYVVKIDPMFFGNTYCDSTAMDVTPELEVVGCFGYRAYRKPLSTFESIKEFFEDIQEEECEIQSIPPQKECLTCPRHLVTGKFCACLGYRQKGE